MVAAFVHVVSFNLVSSQREQLDLCSQSYQTVRPSLLLTSAPFFNFRSLGFGDCLTGFNA